MKLHVKLSLALLSGLVLVVLIAQLVQYYRAVDLISDLSRSTLATLKAREEGFARNIFNSVDRAVAGSLERGEMEKFTRLLEAQKEVEGLIEFSLYDRYGMVSHSSDMRHRRKVLSADIKEDLLTSPEMIERHADGAIEIYHPQVITGECVRCHTDWEEGKIGGVTSIRMSTEALSRAQQRAAATLDRAKRTFFLNSAVTIGVIIVFFLITMYLTVSRFVKRPLDRVTSSVRDLAEGEGDLTRRLEIVSEDELGELARYFNIFLEKLRSQMIKIKETSETLTGSVHDLSVSSKEVASTSNSQASAVKEVVSTMEDSDKLSKSVAGRIVKVVDIAEKTRENVENGFAITRGNMEKMEEIRTANSDVINGIKALGKQIKSIWEIVEIINSVADQTKIIAFNAELEASAAGEAGKNFEIVASEIRRLANNTMSSTKAIKERIDEVQRASDSLIDLSEAGTQKIAEGWKVSKSLDAVFQEVLDSSETSADSAQKISESINQQADAFEQILLTLKQISDGIDNFVVSTEATTQASETLRVMADYLKGIVGKYAV
jgi:methyl-accepting chemotaxis protein